MRLGALNPEEPFSGSTTLTTISENSEKVNEVIASSRQQYAIKHVEKKQEQYRGGYVPKQKVYKSKRRPGNILP